MSIIFNPNGNNNGLSLTYFCIGRIFTGFALGIYSSVVPAYINEIAPKHYTGMFGTCHQLCITIATLITATIGVTLPKLSNEETRSSPIWRLGYGAPLIFSLVQSILLFTIYKYESPLSYIYKDDKIMAKEALSMMYESYSDIEQLYEEIEDINKKFNKKAGFHSLYKSYSKAFWIGILLPIIQQFTGINSIMFYAPTMFESQGNNKDLLVFIVHITNFPFTMVTTFIADRVGRRTLLIIGCTGRGLGSL